MRQNGKKEKSGSGEEHDRGPGRHARNVTPPSDVTGRKLLGAAYLIYLGLRALLDHRRDRHQSMRRLAPRSLRRIFVDAVVRNILNPKTAVFFLAFVPQFVDTSRGDAATQLVVLGVVFIALGLASDGAYALAAGWIGERINRVPVLARRSNLAAGFTYLGLGLAAATTPSTRQT